ncbi:MAG: SDR family NAD(P)-dependent oxidoreductase [Bacteroidota bacterium]
MAKRALVTGADGFIGSHLVEALLRQNVDVRAFVMYNSFSSNGWLDRLPKSVRKAIDIFPGDIRDAQRVNEALEGVDAVFHLAALISIPYSYRSPASYMAVNVDGTLNVLEAAKQQARQKVLVVSSSEVYGTAQYVPIDEQHPVHAQSPYSASKIAAESLATAYWSSFDTPVTVVRPFNTYGPRQSARAIIPTIITQLLQGESPLHLGDLRPSRDLTYVSDTVQAMIQVLFSEATTGKTLNIASEQEISIGELAQRIIDKIQPGTPIVQDRLRMRPPKSEVERLLGSGQQLSTLVNWTPNVDLNTGLDRCIEWYGNPRHLAGFQSDHYYF